VAKLVSIESGFIVPLPGTSDESDGEDIIIHETHLIIDGDDITIISENGFMIDYKNHKLELNERSNYRERPLLKRDLFFIRLRDKFAYIRSFINRHFSYFTCFFIRIFQTIFRKSHISYYDLMDLHCYLAKRSLPKIIAYRDCYLEREFREIPHEWLFDNLLFHNKTCVYFDEELSEEEILWITVMNEIIFAMQHLCKKTVDDYDIEVEKRVQQGFELFGKFFLSLWY